MSYFPPLAEYFMYSNFYCLCFKTVGLHPSVLNIDGPHKHHRSQVHSQFPCHFGMLAPRRNQEEAAPEIAPELPLEAVLEAPQELPQELPKEEYQEEFELEEMPLEDPMEQDSEEYMPADSDMLELEEHVPVNSGNEDSLFGNAKIFHSIGMEEGDMPTKLRLLVLRLGFN